MSPDRFGTALRNLVDDVEDGMTPPVADDLWAGGRRRRRTVRLVPVLAAACVAALVAIMVWPGGAPRASVPAVQVDDDGHARLTSYPAAIPKPPLMRESTRPGVSAAVLTEPTLPHPLYAVSPSGAVTRLQLPDFEGAPVGMLSPDGRWLARGLVLTDLVDGVTQPSAAVRADLASTREPPVDPAWWSPDSRRVLVGSANSGEPRSSGLVVATDGSMTEVPLLPRSPEPIVAGWIDNQTVLAFVHLDEGTGRLEGRTWRVGDPSWEVADVDVEWPALAVTDPSRPVPVQAALSPDGARLVLTAAVADSETAVIQTTRAMMFDARTGAQLGMPGVDGTLSPSSWDPGTFVEWGGFGCRVAWHDGLPVRTDGGLVQAPLAPSGDALVDVSGRYEAPCVAFAGDELRGIPETDSRALWQERLWVWGGRLLGVAGLAALVWWFTRRRAWREPPGPGPEPHVIPARG